MNKVTTKDLVMPYFVIEGESKKEEIKSMPGIFRLTIDNLLKDIGEARELGIRKVLLFGLPEKKDRYGLGAYRGDGVVQKAVSAIKKGFVDLTVITDVCLCAYTSHGHCAVLKSDRKVVIDLEKTLEALASIAVSHAGAGADMVAPSAMMKRQVGVIRKALDGNGFEKIKIMGYSAKFASSFYGPFREAMDSSPAFGDRRAYQLDYRSSIKALREIEQDIKEGADMVMVKPALAYLDVIRQAKQKFGVSLAAYNVSGEYSMVKAAGEKGWINELKVALEILTAIKRAGADIIITYHAKEVAKII